VSLWRVFWCREMIQRIGTASAILQKAVAIGPVAARRTKNWSESDGDRAGDQQ
jgi:hypothetical protein